MSYFPPGITSYNASISTRDRHLACTHLQMTRLYDEYGCEKCSMCHKRPSLGWLYRCTQDSDGHIPGSDFFDIQCPPKHSQDARLYTLSPSIVRGIAEGRYTDQQIHLMVQQKMRVRQTINGNQLSLSDTATESSLSSFPASTTFSTLHSYNSDTDPEICTEQICRRPLPPIKEVKEVKDDCADLTMLSLTDRLTEVETAPFPCNFKVCQTCRPTYRDRAWESLTTILNEHVKIPPPHEFNNRRVSDVRILKTIGTIHQETKPDFSNICCEIEVNASRNISRADFQNTVRRVLRSSQLSTSNTNAIDDTQESGHSLTALDGLQQPRNLEKSGTLTSLIRPLHLRRGLKSPMKLDISDKISVLRNDGSASSLEPFTGNSARSSPPVLQHTADHCKKISHTVLTLASEFKDKSVFHRSSLPRTGSKDDTKQVWMPGTEPTHFDEEDMDVCEPHDSCPEVEFKSTTDHPTVDRINMSHVAQH